MSTGRYERLKCVKVCFRVKVKKNKIKFYTSNIGAINLPNVSDFFLNASSFLR